VNTVQLERAVVCHSNPCVAIKHGYYECGRIVSFTSFTTLVSLVLGHFL